MQLLEPYYYHYVIFSSSAGYTLIFASPEDSITSIGQTLFLSCLAFSSGGGDGVHITWRKNGSTLYHDTDHPQFIAHPSVVTQRGDKTIIKSILEVCVNEKDVEDTYSCLVENSTTILDEETFQIKIGTSIDKLYSRYNGNT